MDQYGEQANNSQSNNYGFWLGAASYSSSYEETYAVSINDAGFQLYTLTGLDTKVTRTVSWKAFFNILTSGATGNLLLT